jgi:uncharacterized membrane protein
MMFLSIVLVFFAILHIPPLARLQPLATRRDRAAFAIGLAFLFTGTMHFAQPDRFMSMMPPWMPAPRTMVYWSGVLELLGGVGLFLRLTRPLAGIGLILLLIAIFPANLHQALTDGALYYWVRLPFQAVYIAWLVWSTRPLPERTGFSPERG